MQYGILTIGQLNRYLKAWLEENDKLREVFIRGEVSNFVRHFQSGHCYFTLKEDAAAIRCVMFRSYAANLPFTPENGMSVIVHAQVSFYEKDGTCQLVVYDLQPDGVGTLHLAFEQRKAKLQQQGLFDASHKKALPRFPQRIGIITSEGAAALQDILQILTRRYPLAKVILYPAYVQGDQAPASLIAGISYFNTHRSCDVILIARGGGSIEELWAFNDEALAYAVYQSEIPIISAVGHETDFTICDFAADLRAPTPSAAAELAAPDRERIAEQLYGYYDRIRLQTEARQRATETALREYSEKFSYRYPAFLLNPNRQKLNFLIESIWKNMQNRMTAKQQSLQSAADRIQNRSPLTILQRGFSITAVGDTTVRSMTQVSVGDTLKTRVTDGTIVSVVTELREKDVQA